MKRIWTGMAVALTVLLVMAGPVKAASEPVSIRIVNTITAGGFHGRAVVTGAVKAACKDGPPVVTGTGEGFHVEDRLVCPGGTLFLSAEGTAVPHVDPVACIVRVTQHGTFRITGGTGQYAGITASGTWTGEGRQILVRTAEGCALDQPPRVVVRTLKLIGTLNR
ncbi:MAG TPA: hypothetical protein VHG90_13570 [Acidimicrobiales bacterium]|nr:hypothetical protein [Acidimicrobiales bacterium]